MYVELEQVIDWSEVKRKLSHSSLNQSAFVDWCMNIDIPYQVILQ